MSYQQALAQFGYDSDTIERFIAYHTANPWVWKTFETCAATLIKGGKKRIGAKQIVEEMRYHKLPEHYGVTFKINNNYTALYARVFVIKYPEHRDRIELREVNGLKKFEQSSLEFRAVS